MAEVRCTLLSWCRGVRGSGFTRVCLLETGVQFGTAGRPDMMIVDPGKLRELTDMGFTEEQAEEALLHRHSVADCVTYICNKGELQRRVATPPPPTPPAGTWTAGEGAQAFPPLNGDAFPPLRDDPIGGDEAKGHEPSDDGRPAGPAFGETGFSYSDAARNGREVWDRVCAWCYRQG